ncbi:MAG: hypothetical protein ABI790_18775 [Betaproteobacteria bacterium]
MNKFKLMAAASAVCLPMSMAGASVSVNPGANTLSVQEINAKTFQTYEVTRAAFREFRGEYTLENGARLRLSQHGRRFFAEVSGQPRVEVRAAAPDTFVALDGSTELVFRQHDNGVVSKVLVLQQAKS